MGDKTFMCDKCTNLESKALIMGLTHTVSPCFKSNVKGIKECGFWRLDDD